MNNFVFQNPVKIIFGKGSIAELPNNLYKGEKIMLTYGGGSIKKNGVYDQVKKALEGFSIVEFGGIEPNPDFDTLMKAVKICREEGVGFLLAVGGGSVIDGTKLIAAAVEFKGDPWDILAKGADFEDFADFSTEYHVEGFGDLSQYGGIKVFDGSQCSVTLNIGVKIGDIPDYTILLSNGTQVPINQLY